MSGQDRVWVRMLLCPTWGHLGPQLTLSLLRGLILIRRVMTTTALASSEGPRAVRCVEQGLVSSQCGRKV